MESWNYAAAEGAPSSFSGPELSVTDPGAGSVVSTPACDWPPNHGAPSSASAVGEAGPEEAVWQMTMQPPEGMDGTQGPYPERPGEPDCSYYMRTGVCGFGMTCHFNHPSNRKLAAAVARGKGEYPERLGQPECQYYLKTGTCKFGATCKYHHPREKAGSTGRVQLNVLGLPLRPGEKECAYYMRTGSCKYGVTCKYHHPQPAAVGALVSMSGSHLYAAAGTPSSPALQPYPTGVPSWPIARPPPYLQGPRLQGPSSYAHVILPPHQGLVSMTGWNTYQGPVGPLASPEGQQHALGAGFVYGAAPQTDPLSGSIHGTYPPYMQGSSTMGVPALQPQSSGAQKDNIFPDRPGQPECQYYMKTGDCKFGITCRYHHPKDRATPSPTCVLSPIGLPLRPGAPPCTFYTRYGICKFGPTCKFDHPLGGLTYSPSASSLADMPVAPCPIGSSPTTLAPSSSAEAPNEGPSVASSSNEPAPLSEEAPSHHQSRESSESAALSTPAGANLTTQVSSLGTASDSQAASPGAS